MRMILSAVTAILSAVLLVPAVQAQENLEIPIRGFQWKLATEPSEKDGGKEALVKISDADIEVNGEKIPGLRIDMKRTENNSLIFTRTLEKPLDMLDDWNDLTMYLRWEPASINANKFFKIELGNAEGGWCRPGVRPLENGLRGWKKWDPMYEPAWAFADLRHFDKIRFTIPMNFTAEETESDGKKEKAASPEHVTLYLTGVTAGRNERWSKKSPDRDRRWREWIRYIEQYKPDYSDSSKMLEAPEKGRLAEPLSLTVAGKPNAEIVVTKDPDGVIDTAAHELQHWIREISGAELPIVEKPGSMPVRIFLNDAAFLARHPKEAEYLRDLKPHFGADGFLIGTEGNNIFISGAIPKGAMNGMYRFLENNTGIIFARLDPAFGTVYDKNPDIRAVWGEGMEKPMTSFRGWRGAPDEWSARNGANAPMSPKWGGRGEILGNFSDYLPNKPPYQVWAEGKYHHFGYYNSQVCIGQKDSYDLILKNLAASIKKRLDKGERVDSINWVTEDNWRVCTCENCLKPITLPDGTVLKSTGVSNRETMSAEEKLFRSNQFYLFANRLARGLKEIYPNVRLQLLAYFFMEPAPLFELEDNIQIVFAPLYTRHDFRSPIFSPMNNLVWENRKKLLDKCRNMELYEYYFHQPGAEVMRADIEDYADAGFEHVGSEISSESSRAAWYDWDFAGPDLWAFNRLAWNYRQSPESVLKFYLRRVYREAAPVMEKFYGLIKEKYYAGMRRQHGSTYQGWMDSAIFEPGHGAEIQTELKEALGRVKNPISRIHLGRFIRQYDQFYNAWLVRKGKLPAPPKPDENAIPEKEIESVRNQIMNSWHSDRAFFSRTRTTIEFNGEFSDVVRFRFTLPAKPRPVLEASSFFYSKWMGENKEIPLQGRIVFNLRMLTPGKMPVFSIFGKGESFADPEKDFEKIGDNVWRMRFRPKDGKVDLSDITGFRFRVPSDTIDPKIGYLEFEVFDIGLEPAPEETEKSVPSETGKNGQEK